MNYYQNLKNELEVNPFEIQSDIAYDTFEFIVENYIPLVIESAISSKSLEAELLIGAEVSEKNQQFLNVQIGQNCEFNCKLDFYSYLLLGDLISRIPGIVTKYVDMNCLSFKIELRQLIHYYYEEMQKKYHQLGGR